MSDETEEQWAARVSRLSPAQQRAEFDRLMAPAPDRTPDRSFMAFSAQLGVIQHLRTRLQEVVTHLQRGRAPPPEAVTELLEDFAPDRLDEILEVSRDESFWSRCADRLRRHELALVEHAMKTFPLKRSGNG